MSIWQLGEMTCFIPVDLESELVETELLLGEMNASVRRKLAMVLNRACVLVNKGSNNVSTINYVNTLLIRS